MANIVLYKDTPVVLEDFAKDFVKNAKTNLDAKRSRTGYRAQFKRRNFIASKLPESVRTGRKKYRATGDLINSIEYKIVGLKLYISFNEYGVMLDRGTDGYWIRQTSNESLLYDANINYGDIDNLFKSIERWTKRRGIVPRKIGGFGYHKLKNDKHSRDRMNFLISRSLYNRGINATYWFTRPFLAIEDKLPNDLIFGMFKTIDQAFDTIFNKNGRYITK